jgi:hypothetical protein
MLLFLIVQHCESLYFSHVDVTVCENPFFCSEVCTVSQKRLKIRTEFYFRKTEEKWLFKTHCADWRIKLCNLLQNTYNLIYRGLSKECKLGHFDVLSLHTPCIICVWTPLIRVPVFLPLIRRVCKIATNNYQFRHVCLSVCTSDRLFA